MPISCHFRDCKALSLFVTSLTYEHSATASTGLYLFTSYEIAAVLRHLYTPGGSTILGLKVWHIWSLLVFCIGYLGHFSSKNVFYFVNKQMSVQSESLCVTTMTLWRGGWLTESAEIEAEAPLGVDVLEAAVEHFNVTDRVEHHVDDDWQRHEARDAHPGGVQQIRQRHELNTFSQ